QTRYTEVVKAVLRSRGLLMIAYPVIAAVIIWVASGQLGTSWLYKVDGLDWGQLGMEIFPTVDAGQFQLRLRAPTGTRIQRTEELTVQALEVIKEAVGADNVDISVAYVGVVSGNYPINNVYLWLSGPEEAVVRVALRRGSGVRVEELKARLRDELQKRLEGVLKEQLRADGLSGARAEERARALRLS